MTYRDPRCPRWQNVNDFLPPIGKVVDVWDRERGRVPDCSRVEIEDQWTWASANGEDLRMWTGFDEVTHWRTIPEGPE